MNDTMKVGVVVVTHGQLATELVNSVEMIVGDLPHVAAVSIGWHDDADRAREEIRQAIARVDNEEVAGVAGEDVHVERAPHQVSLERVRQSGGTAPLGQIAALR